MRNASRRAPLLFLKAVAGPAWRQVAAEALPELQRRVGLDAVVPWLDLGITVAESSGAAGLKYLEKTPGDQGGRKDLEFGRLAENVMPNALNKRAGESTPK